MHDGNDDDDIDLEGDNNNDSFIIIIIFIFAIYATFYTRGNTGLILSQASSLKNRS